MSAHNDNLITELMNGVVTHSASETESIAAALASLLPENHVLALHGDLGAGKTTFIRGLSRGLEIKEPVTSPTFNLYTIHKGTRTLVHLDAYRLNSGSDLETLMIDDFLTPPWCFAIEWPERIIDSIPEGAWHLYLEIDSAHKAHRIQLKY